MLRTDRINVLPIMTLGVVVRGMDSSNVVRCSSPSRPRSPGQLVDGDLSRVRRLAYESRCTTSSRIGIHPAGDLSAAVSTLLAGTTVESRHSRTRASRCRPGGRGAAGLDEHDLARSLRRRRFTRRCCRCHIPGVRQRSSSCSQRDGASTGKRCASSTAMASPGARPLPVSRRAAST